MSASADFFTSLTRKPALVAEDQALRPSRSAVNLNVFEVTSKRRRCTCTRPGALVSCGPNKVSRIRESPRTSSAATSIPAPLKWFSTSTASPDFLAGLSTESRTLTSVSISSTMAMMTESPSTLMSRCAESRSAPRTSVMSSSSRKPPSGVFASRAHPATKKRPTSGQHSLQFIVIGAFPDRRSLDERPAGLAGLDGIRASATPAATYEDFR